ncbi:MAG: hypothetical protein K0R36_570 [Chryseobacterium sp.]|nr:hypothetical protein [Chryseobacterium sp.]
MNIKDKEIFFILYFVIWSTSLVKAGLVFKEKSKPKISRVGNIKTIFIFMRKLLFFVLISAMSLVLFSCSNETSSVTPEQPTLEKLQKIQAKEGEELTPESEKALIDEALAFVERSNINNEDEPQTEIQRILCHTKYGATHGHACVWEQGFLVNVEWQPSSIYQNPDGYWNVPPNPSLSYSGTVVTKCNC